MGALAQHSIILIDELILPDTGIHYKSANLDMTMMCNAGAIERTETQWRTLLNAINLKIKDVLIYDEEMKQGVLMVVRV